MSYHGQIQNAPQVSTLGEAHMSATASGVVAYGVFGLLVAGGAYGGYKIGAHYEHPWVGAVAGAAVAYIPAWIVAAVAEVVATGSMK